MDVIKTVAAMQRVRVKLEEPVGFVPTMGFLHEGHLSLVRRARAENASVVASIFINPTQFGPSEDLERYPRDVARDLTLLTNEGVDIVFTPPATEMYPTGFTTWVVVEKIAERLEGVFRPGHFRGVATVCTKLFNIVSPTHVYFGQKDAQQALVVRRMATDLNMNLKIITLPTVRAPDGLALSSRNAYLSPNERLAAVVINSALRLAETVWRAGERQADAIRRKVESVIKSEPLAQIDYISVADTETLIELDIIKTSALISLAVYIGKTRLIDNVILV